MMARRNPGSAVFPREVCVVHRGAERNCLKPVSTQEISLIGFRTSESAHHAKAQIDFWEE